MNELVFTVTACQETGGYVARWDDPAGGGITTQGDTMDEVASMVKDAMQGYFDEKSMPARARLHFVEDPVLAVS
ncbi:MAG: 2-oxoisovalerate dehydrogenase [Verrucomicrobiaceae bacterium]|nr:2-oxoisovalerate dehydrogenase [Verrucomicrobiaceae bacterium]